MKFLVLLIETLVLAAPTFAKKYTRCSLAKDMHALGVPKSELPQWTCIADKESVYRTEVVGPPNTDGSNDYGIFQINNLYWCKPSNGRFSHNGCHISCDALLKDNIKTAVTCARKIKAEKGFAAWSTWKHCSGSLPSINECFK